MYPWVEGGALKAVIWVVLIYVVAEADFRVYSFAQLKSQAAKHAHYGLSDVQLLDASRRYREQEL